MQESSDVQETLVLDEAIYPTLLDRLQSIFIDTLFIIICMVIFSIVLDHFRPVPDWVVMALFASIFLLYEPLCISYGCTIGNYIKGIRVRNMDDTGKRINIFQSVLRYILKVSLGWLSFITIHSTQGKRAIHDLASGSVMLKANNK